ncbi:hypothetical protein P8452_36784 [Trifolium repens]|nr:hypothetical protein P8452_36784 [Trifolium repens]
MKNKYILLFHFIYQTNNLSSPQKTPQPPLQDRSTFTADHRAGNCSNRAGKFVASVLCLLFSGDKRGRSKLWREKKRLDDE